MIVILRKPYRERSFFVSLGAAMGGRQRPNDETLGVSASYCRAESRQISATTQSRDRF